MRGVLEIVVASGKGGVGKSLVAASLAVILARKGYRLVAVDADAEAPNLHIVLGVGEWSEEVTLHEGKTAYIIQDQCTRCGECLKACQFGAIYVREGRYYINPWVCEGCYTCSFVCPVKAIRVNKGEVSGRIRVASRTRYGFPLVSSESVPGRPNSGKVVTEAKNVGRRILGSEGLMLVDSAAGIGCQVISSLAGANIAVLVAEPTPASFSDLKRVHKLAKHFYIPSALIINKSDLNPGFKEEILGYAEKERIDFLGEIPFDEVVPYSMGIMKPVIEAFPESRVSKRIHEIGERLAGIIEDYENWKRKHLPEKPEPFIPIVIKPGEG
ncbi:nucleotide-binding protein [Thermogladius sp. 4427co]|uniref:nucleotide-binding protein n=1 Tax=Thermogladius sp. 4427co TaxID=3450718 RepID=UPI003F796897